MSTGILYCFDNQELDEVARNMGKNQVRRLPLINKDKRLVGILRWATWHSMRTPRRSAEPCRRSPSTAASIRKQLIR